MSRRACIMHDPRCDQRHDPLEPCNLRRLTPSQAAFAEANREHSGQRLAWRLTITSGPMAGTSCVTFAATPGRARWILVRHLREWASLDRRSWPGIRTRRAPEFDRSVLRYDNIAGTCYRPDFAGLYERRD